MNAGMGSKDVPGTLVTDVHGKIHHVRVHDITRPETIPDLLTAMRSAWAAGRAVSIAGGRHAMGGQQFGEGTCLIDTRALNRVLGLDRQAGIVEVEAGIQWPELIHELAMMQANDPAPWSIIQKQTGADRLSLGGALSANVHGRGLGMRPIISDVESFTMIDANGDLKTCDRRENADVFRLAIGGYGLFGVIATVKLRLQRRTKVQRVVREIEVDDLIPAIDGRVADGFTYGDFQFAIDPDSNDFLRGGVFSCYRPVDVNTPIKGDQRALSLDDWRKLLLLGHVDKRAAVDLYRAHYLATDGQIYWSDTHQLSEYIDDYHVELDRYLGSPAPATELITEIYVPRASLPAFFADVRDDFRSNKVDVIYGTVRMIERDDESFLAWAREPWACTIFNLHTVHTESGIATSAQAFRRLIDLAIAYRGSFYPTYGRFATKEQMLACHPRVAEFLAEKRRRDPLGRFQSDWYRHYAGLFDHSAD